MKAPKIEEQLIYTIAGLLSGARHVAVGVLSPIPGAATILNARENGGHVSIIGSELPKHRCDGGISFFDQAAQGRIDAFFLSGGQIDGSANINLTGIGSYPSMDTRWSGAFGSAYLYYLVPKVILFREEHSRRVFVDKVDFISSPGVSQSEVHRPGGPYALVTGKCVMMFDRTRSRFRLASLHQGVSLEEVQDCTGFDFDVPEKCPVTTLPSDTDLSVIRSEIAQEIALPYPTFARDVLNLQP